MATEKTVTPGPSDLAEENRRLKMELEAARAELAKKDVTLQKYKDAMKVGKEAILSLKANIQELQDANSSTILNSSLVGESADAERDKVSAEALRGNSGSFYQTISDNKAVSAAVVIVTAAAAGLAYKRFG